MIRIDGAYKEGHDKTVWVAEMISLVALLSFLVYKNIIPSDILMKVIKAIIDAL